MTALLQRDPASFRDPSGYVFSDGHRVFRGLGAQAWIEYERAVSCGLLKAATERGLLIASYETAPDDGVSRLRGARGEIPDRVLEHPRIPFISYPYEWTFGQLKDAALRHLELHLLALEHDFELSDATAYNMQFECGEPVHIDVLSLRPYRPGRPWAGYNQFCRQFLSPLLVESVIGLPFQRLYRGSPDGIDVQDLRTLLPPWRCLTDLNILMHVQFQSSAVRKASSHGLSGRPIRLPEIPKSRYTAMLRGMREWIEGMKPARASKTYWADYACLNSYSADEKQIKQAFVERTLRAWGSTSVLDVGGNTGDYSLAALASGAARSYCLDSDVDALDKAYARSKSGAPGLMPLVGDWSDPSPGQGWRGRERRSLEQRLHADSVIALALIHHVVIGRNIPMAEFIDQLFAFGRTVIVEFVPKGDAMVQGLLRTRDDVFPDYTEDGLMHLISARAEICAAHRLRNGRLLLACRAHEAVP